MIRRAFTMRLKPGHLAEYTRKHDNIWPELLAEIEKSGIAHFTTFERDPDLFLYSEIYDEEAWNRLWTSEIHKKWGDVMIEHMQFRSDGIVDFSVLKEVFHYEPKGRSVNGRPKANGRKRAKAASAKSKKKPARSRRKR